MMSRLQDLWRELTAPRATDEHEARREYFVNVILVGAGAIDFVYSLVTALAYCTMTGVPLPTVLAGVLALPVSPLGLWLSRRGRWRVAALAPLLALLGITVYGQYHFGEYDVAIVLYGAIVIIAGIVYGSRVAAGATMVSVLSYGIVGWLQLDGRLPPTDDVGLPSQVIAIGASLGIIALLQWLFTSQLQEALRKSRTYAQELSKHRERLEELVKERTAALRTANAQLQQKIVEREKVEAERERLLVAERAQARRQAALLRLSAELAATLDEAEVCRRVVNGLRDTLGHDFVALCLVDETTGDRVVAASVGFVEPPTRIPPGEGLSERPLLDGQLQYTPDVTQDPRYLHGMGGSEVDVPVRIGGEVVGVLIAESRQTQAFNQDDLEVLTAAAQQAGLAIEKARLLAAERQRADELDALRTTMADITAELELSALLQVIVERAAGLLDAVGGELGLYDEASQEIRIVVSRNLDQDYVGTRMALGEGAMGRVAESGEPLIIEDYRTWEGRAPQYADLPVHASLTAPLAVGGRLVGAISIAATDPARQFGPADLHLLNLFAQQAAVAIENARLFEVEQRRAEQFRVISEVGRRITSILAVDELLGEIARLLKENLGYYLVGIGLIEGDELIFKAGAGAVWETPGFQPPRLKVGQEGITGWVAQSGQPLLAPDLSQESRYYSLPQASEMQSELAVPLKAKEAVIGVLHVQSDRLSAFDESDVVLLQSLADQAAIAIENARLFAETERRVAEMATLTEVGQALSSTLRVDEVLQLIYEQTRRVMYAEDMIIGFYYEAHHEFECVFSTNPDDVTVGTRFPADAGVTGYVIKHRKSFLAPDNVVERIRELGIEPIGQPSASGLVVPMLRGERVLGVIVLQHYTIPNVYDESHQVLLETVASQAAIAIENARLYDQAQREIAERERAEEELREYQEHLEELVEERTADLRESEERYRTLFDGVPVGLYRTTPAGQILDASLAGVQMLSYPSREELLAIGSTSLYVDPEERVRWQALMEREGVVRDFETQMYKHDGTMIWVNNTARAVRDEGGRVLYYEGSLEDITERKRAEAELQKYQEHLEELVEERTAELRESEQRYRTLFDGVPVGLYRTTPAGQILDANLAAVQMLGYPSRNDLLATSTISLFADPMEAARARVLLDKGEIVRDFEMRLNRYDNTVIWANYAARAVRDEGGRVLHYEGSMEDITERKGFEEEIRRQKEYFEALFVNSPVAALTADLDANVVSWNPMAEKLFGYTQEEAIGKHVDDLVANDPRIWEEALDYTRQAFREGRVQATTKRTRRDGSLVDVEARALPVIVAGEIVGYIAIYHDISELQQARRAAEAANQAKSTFLANMSHELRTPLNAIVGFTRLVKRRSKDVLPQKQLDNLDKVLVSADHLLGLINDVLDLSKIEAGRTEVQPVTFSVEPLIGACLQTVRPLVRSERLRLVKEIEPDLPTLFTDQDKVRQILINLLSNALKFTEEGAVTVTAQRRGEAMLLAVADTGIGIPEEALERIFEEFQQLDDGTTRKYGGTGLGLSISRHLARLLGGDITVDSEVGVGSTFTAMLPIRYTVTPRATIAAPLSQTAPETVILQPEDGPVVLAIDDDPNVIYLLQENLTEAGYRVVGATRGEEGVRKAREIRPLAIILDILMSPKDGWQVLHELKADAATRDIPVVVLSIVDNRELGYRLGAFDYLVKPFDREAILSTLYRIAPVEVAPAQVRLLVVDDDPKVMDLVSQLLEGEAYHIQSAADGQEALETVSQQCPDIILLDLLMPRLDGFGMIEQLRQCPEHANIPIIVLTAKKLTADELAQLQQRVSTVIQKHALERETLLRELQAALQAYRRS